MTQDKALHVHSGVCIVQKMKVVVPAAKSVHKVGNKQNILHLTPIQQWYPLSGR